VDDCLDASDDLHELLAMLASVIEEVVVSRVCSLLADLIHPGEVGYDQVDLHEWQLRQQTPRLSQLGELMSQRIETAAANQVAREVVSVVSACHLQTISQHLRAGTDLDGTPLAPPLEETPPAPDRHGGKRNSASARSPVAVHYSCVDRFVRVLVG
jgi:hypothetical protein